MANSYAPIVGAAAPRLARNEGGDRRRGCVALGEIASPVHLPDQRFDVSDCKMPQPPSAVEPGKGAIPVNPWDASGLPNRAASNLEIPREPKR